MNSFVIEPYKNVGMLKFGANKDELKVLMGDPSVARRNFFKEEVLYYENMSIALSRETSSVVEIIFNNKCRVLVAGIDIFSDPEVIAKLLFVDDTAFEGTGCVAFLKLGVALTGFPGADADKSLAAFAKGRWDQLVPQMRKLDASFPKR